MIQLIILHKAQGPAKHLTKPTIRGGRGGRADLGEGAHQRHWLCLYRENVATLKVSIMPRVHNVCLNWEMSLLTHKREEGRYSFP